MGRRWRERTAPAVAVMAAVGFGFTGCGSNAGDSPPTDVSVVAAAAQRMATAGTCLWTSSSTTPGSSGTARGSIDFRHHRAVLQRTLVGADGSHRAITEIFDGSAVYVRGLPFGANSKRWTKAVLPNGYSPVSAPNIGSDPASALAVLSAHAPVTIIGTEKIRGAATTHFRQSSPNPSVHFQTDVWIDAKGLVRRLAVTTNFPTGGPVESTLPAPLSTVTEDFFDFGASVSITVPPPDEVTDLTQSHP